MTPRQDTPKKRHPTEKQAAFIARLRDKGLGLAPVVEGGRVVRSKAPGRTSPARGALRAPVADRGLLRTPGRVEDPRPLASAFPGGTFEVTIPAPCPFLNANRDKSLHWAEKGRLVKAWRDAGRAAAERAGLPKDLPKVQIDAYVVKPVANRFDPANWAPTAKPVVDGMVSDYGLCADDDRLHVAGPFMHDGGKGANALIVRVTIV